MTAKVIMNPYSARWKSLERKPQMEDALHAAEIAYELTLTERKRHAEELAFEAVKAGFNPIIAAGGDGTIGEVVTGMLRASPDSKDVQFGVMPLGTANDLVDNLGLPTDLSEAAKVIAAGNIHKLDVIQVNDRYFINNAGLGLEPYTTTYQERMTWLRGTIRYLVATIWAIMKNPQWEMKLEWDDGSYEGPVTLISIGNNACTGEIFYTVPHADPFDGKLTFTFGFLPTRRQIFRALPMIMKPDEGNITEHPAVQEIHATWLKVQLTSPSPAHSDGELFSNGIQEVKYKVFPGRLDILM